LRVWEKPRKRGRERDILDKEINIEKSKGRTVIV